MIFVVCGTQKFALNRLLKAVDDLVAAGKIQEEVFVQKGHSDYPLKHCKSADFLDVAVFDSKIKDCSLLITHGGIGTILAGKKFSKPIIVFPRLERYGEHVDDHQRQIAKEFSSRELVMMCEDTAELENCILRCREHRFKNISQEERGRDLEEYINRFIDTMVLKKR
ncbi:MAG: glycosyltransferase [Eubacteriales bacterium]|nr:glycosyltransferase [Eubacteriales bacterium]